VADTPLLPGTAAGPALVLDEALSMWGGLDPHTGVIIDRRHPQRGAVVTGSVLVMPVGRGSSSAASILAESIRLRTAPVAIVLAEPDGILLVGALAAEETYDITCPIVVTDDDTYRSIRTGDRIDVTPQGITVHRGHAT
jgi:uncharacterized protein